jgi:hypothetical protein
VSRRLGLRHPVVGTRHPALALIVLRELLLACVCLSWVLVGLRWLSCCRPLSHGGESQKERWCRRLNVESETHCGVTSPCDTMNVPILVVYSILVYIYNIIYYYETTYNQLEPVPVPSCTHTHECGYGFYTGVGTGQGRVTHGLPVTCTRPT